MSKVLVNTNDATNALSVIGQGLTQLVDSTKSKKNFKLLVASDNALTQLARTMAAFVAVDVKFEGGAAAIGTILMNFEKQDEAVKIKVLRKLCDVNGIEVKDDSALTGRKGLILAMFGKYPEMMKLSGKDTLAGKRISYYLGVAKGTIQRPQPGALPSATATAPAPASVVPEQMPSGATSIGGAAELFVTLYNAALDDGEQQMLLELAQRANVEYEDWIKDAE